MRTNPIDVSATSVMQVRFDAELLADAMSEAAVWLRRYGDPPVLALTADYFHGELPKPWERWTLFVYLDADISGDGTDFDQLVEKVMG